MLKIIADSTCDLLPAEAESLGITIIPMKILIDEKEYTTGVNLTPKEFYEKLANCKKLPQTTLITDVEYEETIKNALESCDEVFVMCLSSELSGSFNNLQRVYEQLNSPRLEIFDSKSVTFEYKAMVLEAVRLSRECKTAKELKEKLQKAVEKLKLLAVVDNVKYLIKGGRLSLMKGLAVTALNIKPVLTIKDGKLSVVSKGIGYQMACRNLVKEIKSIDTTRPVYFAHSNDEGKLNILKKCVNEKFEIKNSQTSIVGAVIGTHTGPGCAGIVYFEGL